VGECDRKTGKRLINLWTETLHHGVLPSLTSNDWPDMYRPYAAALQKLTYNTCKPSTPPSRSLDGRGPIFHKTLTLTKTLANTNFNPTSEALDINSVKGDINIFPEMRTNRVSGKRQPGKTGVS
jgi:hypothetical protein